jgi:hypothetical protein
VHASETRVGVSEKQTRWTGVYADCVFVPLLASSSLGVDAVSPSTGMFARAVLQEKCAAPGWTLPR